MIYSTPPLTSADELVLADIDALRDELRFYLRTPRRWYGTVRRATFARAVQGSNSIEGYHASVEDVAAVIEDEEPLDADDETRAAISGYRDAMTYVMQLAPDAPTIDASLLRSLHFMMMKYDLSKNPGQWRPGAVWVRNEQGDTVYEAPDRDAVDDLIDELLVEVNEPDGPQMIAGAMAHLNLALIHPFSDGNGRMARCLQTFVIARDGVLSPEFSSIEEYLGRNTTAYYDALTEVAQGSWSPHRSARSWIEFCLTAHYRQAATLLRRIQEAEALWDRCEQAATEYGLADRTVGALSDAARGWRLRRSLYIKITESSSGEPVSAAMATRDLSAMAKAGLLVAVGQKRGRHYEASDELRALWLDIRTSRKRKSIPNPYDQIRSPQLPGVE